MCPKGVAARKSLSAGLLFFFFVKAETFPVKGVVKIHRCRCVFCVSAEVRGAGRREVLQV
jgi:hypothetical protein